MRGGSAATRGSPRPSPKYENLGAALDGPPDRGLGRDLARVSRALPRVPLAGLSLDRGLGLPTLPAFVRFAGVAFLVVGLGGLAWCFSLFAGARGTPNPRLPPSRLVTSGPYAWTRNPIAGSHFLAVLGVALVIGSPGA